MAAMCAWASDKFSGLPMAGGDFIALIQGARASAEGAAAMADQARHIWASASSF